MADTVSELLPCPFCGGKAAIDRADTLWAVACDDEAEANCLAGVTWGRYPTRAAAITAWNTRAATQPAPAFPRAEVERVVETALYNSAMNGSSAEVGVTAREITDAIAALLQGKQP